jgi:hypothetical protein
MERFFAFLIPTAIAIVLLPVLVGSSLTSANGLSTNQALADLRGSKKAVTMIGARSAFSCQNSTMTRLLEPILCHGLFNYIMWKAAQLGLLIMDS